MARLADVPVDLLPGVETLLFRGGERRDGRRRAWLAGPGDARQDCRCAWAELAAARCKREERCRSAVQTKPAHVGTFGVRGRSDCPRPRKRIRTARTRPPAGTARTRKTSVRRRPPAAAIRASGRRGAQQGDFRAAQDRTAHPGRTRAFRDRREDLLHGRILSAAHNRRRQHGERGVAPGGLGRTRAGKPLDHRRLQASNAAERRVHKNGVATTLLEQRRHRLLARTRRQRAKRSRQLPAYRPVHVEDLFQHHGLNRMCRLPQPPFGDAHGRRAHVRGRVFERTRDRGGLDGVHPVERPQRMQPGPPVRRTSGQPHQIRDDGSISPLDQQLLGRVATPAVGV